MMKCANQLIQLQLLSLRIFIIYICLTCYKCCIECSLVSGCNEMMIKLKIFNSFQYKGTGIVCLATYTVTLQCCLDRPSIPFVDFVTYPRFSK